jgi:methionyl-tRNA synthetase
MPETPKKFYLTTPIYYVNARPHIGHAYSTIAADVIARRHRLLGDDTFFLTGTDEHGQKVQRSAAAAGVPPQQFTDEVSATFRNLWKRMGITNDDYIRTTDERHKRGVQKLWSVLEERGAIYLSSYTGAYCVSDEAFVDLPAGTPCPDCGRPLEIVTEENYFFKLSEYADRIIQLIESGELHIQPETVRNEVLSFVRGGLKDLSISRTTFDWGIPVPGNPKHVIYVWLDALANYMTAVGYGSDDPADQAKFARYWPADLHLVGKEITRFHCVYWPAFLMAAGIPTPKSVVANGWLLFEESKMSKSRGNVVRTETILDAFGPLCPLVPVEDNVAPSEVVILTLIEEKGKNPRRSPETPQPLAPPTKSQQDLFAADVLRYFLLREIPFGQDGSFSFDALITRYNADLANGYGNLVSRTLKLIEQNLPDGFTEKYSGTFFCGEFEEDRPALAGDEALEWYVGSAENVAERGLTGVPTLDAVLGDTLNSYNFSKALRKLWNFVGMVDLHISNGAPWKLAKSSNPDDIRRLQEILYTAAESIRIVTALLYPVMPYATASVWRQLGLGDIEEAAHNGKLKDLKWGGLKPGTKLGPLAPIFPRADKGLAQIMTDMENPTPAAPEPEAAKSEPTPEALNAVSPSTSASPVPPTDNLQPATVNSPTISIDDFAKIDLRVAQIVVAERIPKADKLLRLEVDLGTERRQILSGIAEFYTPEELIGKRIAIIANLAPRKMRGLESHGMLLAASGEDHSSKPILATFSDEIALGSKIR